MAAMRHVSGWAFVCSVLLGCGSSLGAHESHGHSAPTYEVRAPLDLSAESPRLRLRIVDAATGELLAARFSLQVDERDYAPPGLSSHGLQFISIHQGKRQRFEVTYARGTGDVEVPLPVGTRRGSVAVTKGFEYQPAVIDFACEEPLVTVTARLRRWSNLQAEGWLPADEHLHYERLERRHDADWLTMLDADGLTHAHFMVLKGGNLPGVWAQQFAYGKAGQGTDGRRLLVPGEEYRDGFQGHINLLGLGEVIEPISTGGIGGRSMPFHYPPLLDVFQRAHALGGVGGPAHGATLSRSPTAVLDTVLGEVDFFEIANTHLYELEAWYRVLNAGYIVPPVAGTDLPNFPFRDAWQPFLGEVRTYVRAGTPDFDAWKQALRRGEVFVTSGPMICLKVKDAGPGGRVALPAEGGEVEVEVELASPRPLTSLELIQNGVAVPVEVVRTNDDGVTRWRARTRLRVEHSCWLAARGTGEFKQALEAGAQIRRTTVAHTAAVQILVADEPIATPAAVEAVRRQLTTQREFYRTEARFERDEHRQQFIALFDEGLRRLTERPTQ